MSTLYHKLFINVFAMLPVVTTPCVYFDACSNIHLFLQPQETKNGVSVPKPPILQLNSANIDRHGIYLMDSGEQMLMLVGGAVSDHFCQQVFDKPNFMSIPDGIVSTPIELFLVPASAPRLV